jgi:AbrB family looped-hinge helix DNA binding protein
MGRRTSTSNVTSKGQVTIPAHIRKFLGIGPHDVVEFFVKDGRVEIAPAESVASRTAGIFKGRVQRLTFEEERRLMEEGIAEEADKPNL